MKHKYTIRSSNGNLKIDAHGNVLPERSEYWGDALRDIVRFDLPEWQAWLRNNGAPVPSEMDILEIGYWVRTGEYEPAVKAFREDFGA